MNTFLSSENSLVLILIAILITKIIILLFRKIEKNKIGKKIYLVYSYTILLAIVFIANSEIIKYKDTDPQCLVMIIPGLIVFFVLLII